MSFVPFLRFTRRWLAGLALLTAAAGMLRADDLIVVSAAAIPQYQRSVAGQSAPRLESYVFSPGRYFAGHTKDSSEENTQFLSLAKSLAPALARQNYFPARDPKNAELLIIVHWGTTKSYEDPNREFTIEQQNAALAEFTATASAAGIADPGALNQISADMNSNGSLQERFMAANAELLGYKRSLRTRSQRLFASEEEQTMRYELAEPRYFVVLMAYDYAVLKKEKRRHLLWTTHVNVRSAGTNFTVALPNMAQAAAAFFGRDVADPQHLQTRVRNGQVEIGEFKVVPDRTKD